MLLINLIVALLIPLQPAPPNPDIIYPDIEVTAEVFDSEIVPKNEIYVFLATAVAEVNSLPDDLSNYNGTALLPDETATQLFGYAKWLFSGTSMNELLGASVAPIGINLYVYLTLMIVITSAYITLRVAVLIVRFVQYIIGWTIRFIPFIG